MKLMDLLFGKMINRKISEYQSDLIKKHCDEVENIYKTMHTLTINDSLTIL